MNKKIVVEDRFGNIIMEFGVTTGTKIESMVNCTIADELIDDDGKHVLRLQETANYRD